MGSVLLIFLVSSPGCSWDQCCTSSWFHPPVVRGISVAHLPGFIPQLFVGSVLLIFFVLLCVLLLLVVCFCLVFAFLCFLFLFVCLFVVFFYCLCLVCLMLQLSLDLPIYDCPFGIVRRLYTNHYTENKRLSNTNSTKNPIK